MKGWLIGIIVAPGVLFILLALIFIIAGLSSPMDIPTLIIGIILLLIGSAPIAIVVYLERKKAQRSVEIKQEIRIDGDDLVGGKRTTKELKCKGCSAPLSSDSVRLTDIGMIVKCQYCGDVYALEEEAKW